MIPEKKLSLQQQHVVAEVVERKVLQCLVETYSHSGLNSQELQFLFGYWVHFFCHSSLAIWFGEFEFSASVRSDSQTINFNNVPSDTAAFMGLNRSKHYEQYLRDSLHEAVSKRVLEVDRNLTVIKPSTFKRRSVVLYKSGFCRLDRFLLFISSRGKIRTLREQMRLPELPINHESRISISRSMSASLVSHPFATWMSTRAVEFLPKILVEYFDTLTGLYRSGSPSISAIFSTDCWSSDDALKFFALFCKDSEGRKIRKIGAPHSLNYGCLKYFWLRDFESSCLDHYLTWGWEAAGVERFYPHKFSRTYRRNKTHKLSTNFEIVITGASRPSHLIEYPYSIDYLTLYIYNQIDLARSLAGSLGLRVTIRTRQRDRGTLLEEHIFSRPGTHVQFEYQTSDFLERIKGCLHISDNPSTSIVETFLLNQPTLLIFQNSYFELCDAASNEFMLLERAGILHRSSKSLLSFLGSNINSINEWWGSPMTQTAIFTFLQAQARPCPSITIWKNKLMELSHA